MTQAATGMIGVNHRIAHSDCRIPPLQSLDATLVNRVTVGLVQVILLHNSAEKDLEPFH
jgi:hypothetical protein